MNKLDYLPIGNLRLVTPTIVSIGGNDYDVSTKYLMKRITQGIGLPSVSFSKRLFAIDEDVWRSICEKVSNYEASKEFLSSKKAIISGNTIIGISGSSKIDDLLDQSEILSKELSCSKSHEFINDNLYISLDSKDGTGLLIIYYPDWDWLSVYSLIKIDIDNIYINPYPIVSTEVENSSFDEFLDSDVIVTHLDKEVMIKYHYMEFENDLKELQISIGEIKRLLKNNFGIKYQEGLSAFDIAAENGDFDAKTTSYLTNILSSIDKYQKVALFSPDLKKEITFSTPAIEYYKLLSSLSAKSIKYYESLWSFIELVHSKKLNYSQLNDDISDSEEEGSIDE